MALVTGQLNDLTSFHLQGAAAELWFYPESLGHGLNTPTVSASWLYAGRERKATFVDERAWQVDLVPTGGLRPRSWYRPKLIYLSAGGDPVREEWVPVKLFVPDDGGSFSELVNVEGTGTNPLYVWWSPVEPQDPSPGEVWVNTVTGDVKEY